MRFKLFILAILWTTLGQSQVTNEHPLLKKLYDQLDTQPERTLEISDSLLLHGFDLAPFFRTHLYCIQSDAYYYLGDFRSSAKKMQEAFVARPKSFPIAKTIEMYNSQGQNFDFLGKLDSAFYMYHTGLSLAKQENDSIEISNLYFNIATTKRKQFNFSQSMTYLDSSSQITLDINDSLGMCHNLRALGLMNGLYLNHSKARNNYFDALNFVCREDPAMKCLLYSTIATSFLSEGNFDSTKYWIEKTQECYETSVENSGKQYLLYLKGLYHEDLKDSIPAAQFYQNAMHEAERLGDIEEFLKVGFSLNRMQPSSLSYDSLITLVAWAEEYDIRIGLNEAYKSLSEREFNQGNHLSAYNYLKKASSLTESLFQENNQVISQSMEARFELQEKNNEIAQTKKEIELKRTRWLAIFIGGVSVFLGILGISIYRNKRKRFLLKQKQLEQEKAFLQQLSEVESSALRAQMNPHFIFNALNSIKGLIVGKKDREAAIYITKFSKLVRKVLDHSRSYVISLKKELDTLDLYIQLEKLRFRDSFDVNYEIDKNLDLEAIAIPPALLQPFVENSIWHGFKGNPRQNQLEIAILEAKEDTMQIIIKDNGIGIEKASAKERDERKSHGMAITKKRLEIFATADYHSLSHSSVDSKDYGTKVVIEIPIKPI